MTPQSFEQQLKGDIQILTSHYSSSIEIRITRCGEADDDGVSWDVDLIVRPERMDAEAVRLYTKLGVLLKHGPYHILEEGIAPDRIGYTVSSQAAVY